MNSLFCLIQITFAFPTKLGISTSEFSHFYLSYSLPHPLSKWLCGAELSTGINSQQKAWDKRVSVQVISQTEMKEQLS